VALLYFINSFGAVAGTLLAGFYVVEQLGLIVGLLATGSVNIILGLLILIMDRVLAQRTPEDTVSMDGLEQVGGFLVGAVSPDQRRSPLLWALLRTIYPVTLSPSLIRLPLYEFDREKFER